MLELFFVVKLFLEHHSSEQSRGTVNNDRAFRGNVAGVISE